MAKRVFIPIWKQEFTINTLATPETHSYYVIRKISNGIRQYFSREQDDI